MEASVRWLHILHFHSIGRVLAGLPTPVLAQSLVAQGVLALEAVVSRGPRPAKDNDPVLEPVPLVKRPIALGLDKLV